MKRIKFFDVFFFVVFGLSTVGLAWATYLPNKEDLLAKIEVDGRVYVYPLAKDALLTFQGKTGISYIELKSKTATFLDHAPMPCRDKICAYMGVLSQTGQWSACMPNGVFLSIVGNAQPKVDSQLY